MDGVDDDGVHEEGEDFVKVERAGGVLGQVVEDGIDGDEQEDLDEGAVSGACDVLEDDEEDGGAEGGDDAEVEGGIELKEELGALPAGKVPALLEDARDAVQRVDDEEDDEEDDRKGVPVRGVVVDGARGGEDDVDGAHVEGLEEVLQGAVGGEGVVEADEDDVEEDADKAGAMDMLSCVTINSVASVYM